MQSKYNISVNRYSRSGYIAPEKNLNGFTFTNIGDTACKVNDMVVFPSTTPTTVLGDSRSIGGNEGEIYKGNIRLSFALPIGANPAIEIVQKFYIDNDNL